MPGVVPAAPCIAIAPPHKPLHPIHPTASDCNPRAARTADNFGFSNATFVAADLRNVSLREAVLDRALLTDASLRCADLRKANLQKAKLKGANLHCAKLQSTNLQGAELDGAQLEGAIANEGTTWPDGFAWRKAGVRMNANPDCAPGRD